MYCLVISWITVLGHSQREFLILTILLFDVSSLVPGSMRYMQAFVVTVRRAVWQRMAVVFPGWNYELLETNAKATASVQNAMWHMCIEVWSLAKT
jgi:hypothetical protein